MGGRCRIDGDKGTRRWVARPAITLPILRWASPNPLHELSSRTSISHGEASRRELFGQAAPYLKLVDEGIEPRATAHQYSFVDDDWFRQWAGSPESSVASINQLAAHDLLEKAHLSAMTALIRTKRWADAACLMGDHQNFLGFAAALRGLLESAGDIVDGLRSVGANLAAAHQTLNRCLSGKETRAVRGWETIERDLDHFIHRSTSPHLRLLPGPCHWASARPCSSSIERTRLC